MAKTRVPKTMTKAEVEKLLSEPSTKTATGARDRAAIMLMYKGGLRVGEVVGLRSINLQGEGRKLVFIGKGDREREVAIDGDTRAALDLWMMYRRDLVANGGPLLCRVKAGTREKGGEAAGAGEPVSVRSLQKSFRRYAVRALGEERGREVTPHQLRHTHATELRREGFDLREIQTRLGHANLGTTAIYTHVDDEELAAKIEARGSVAATPDLADLAEKLTPEQQSLVMALVKTFVTAAAVSAEAGE